LDKEVLEKDIFESKAEVGIKAFSDAARRTLTYAVRYPLPLACFKLES